MAKGRSTAERRREPSALLLVSHEVLTAEVAELVLGEGWQRFSAVQGLQSRGAKAAQTAIDASPGVRGTGDHPPGVAAVAAKAPRTGSAAARIPVCGPVGEVEL